MKAHFFIQVGCIVGLYFVGGWGAVVIGVALATSNAMTK